ncbi:protein RRNAD1-like [Amphibalanus amphitrite]|uniref:protein RRNAD1-like n=1 Tax=Amphibalanus amphitrite TaxID=1232801 RepID=UPI001C91BF20|nr:protein RRNAD1-like [Amphibalanus amphitrite]XP_043198857.1 protein RRNAD1-like [Amphibalanus amphitrite]XP_043198858.1 protein RRNAD1-like [Amphibalanus amphitrite]
MAAVCLESGSDADAWRRFLDDAVRFLQMYAHLTDAFILDFFVEDLWNSLPEQWRPILDSWSAETLSFFITLDQPGCDVNRCWPPGEPPPLSLLAFRASCRALSLPRRPVASPAPVAEFLHRCAPAGSPAEPPAAEQWPQDAAAELTPGGGQLKLLQHVFRRHVKPKKQHELRRLARLVELTEPRLVVDLGSGRGHLSRYLAYGSRLPIVCLECNDEFVAGARKLDEELERVVSKREEYVLPARPRHSTCRITEHMDQQAFSQTLCSLTGTSTDSLQFTPVGLHTCGDLAALQLRQFVRSPQCGAVVSVGCCYMKLSTPPADGGTRPPTWAGYPLSGLVAETVDRHGYDMTYEAREMSCHAIEEYAARLAAGGEQHLKVHAYRAALERALVRHDPRLRHIGLRSVNKAHTLTFAEYVARAVSRLSGATGDTPGPVSPSALDLSHSAADLAHWRRVVAFYSLRLMLAPVIETVILLDRQMYLWEHGHPSILVPAFDPKMSPRNFVLIAKKR